MKPQSRRWRAAALRMAAAERQERRRPAFRAGVSPDALANHEAARRTWAALTGRPGHEFLGSLEPHDAPLVAAVRDALAAGATAQPLPGGWAAVQAEGRPALVVHRDLLAAARRKDNTDAR